MDPPQSESAEETLADFGQSFSYGSRTDLTFKFLARFDAGEVGEVARRVFELAGALYDDPDPADLLEYIRVAQAEAYGRRRVNERYRYDQAPFAKAEKPLAESTVALLTSTGHFVAGDDPQPFGVKDMTQAEAMDRIDEFLKAPSQLSEVPVDVPDDDLRVRHGGYDIRGSVADHNVSLPLGPLKQLETEGSIGSLHPIAFSFVGATSQMRLLRHEAPEWADRLAAMDIDVVLLVPV